MPPKSQSSLTASAAAAAAAAAERRHVPLADEIISAGQIRPKNKAPKSNKRKARHDEEGSGDLYIDARASRKILQIGQDLAEEEAAEARAAGAASAKDDAKNAAFEFDYSKFASRHDEDQDDDEDFEVQGGDDWIDDEEEVEEVEIDPNDLDMFHKFIPREGQEDPIFGTADEEESSGQQGTNLADLILEKIAEFEAKQSGQPSIVGGGPPEDAVQIPMKVVEVYSK
ncbi:snoRNA-binding rRNA-processing protein [Ascosphaera aggregata]|nr:snoRNA-binding rRNA-processing protein [Ascosphaera aggregata]